MSGDGDQKLRAKTDGSRPAAARQRRSGTVIRRSYFMAGFLIAHYIFRRRTVQVSLVDRLRNAGF
jgi:hypothetical protein